MNKTKLTLSKAKALAITVMGTCKEIKLISDDGSNQQYSMTVGKFYVLITNKCGYWGVTRFTAHTDRGSIEHYFDTKTLEELDNIADDAERIDKLKELRELASDTPMKLIDAFAEAYKDYSKTLRQSLIKAFEASEIPL